MVSHRVRDNLWIVDMFRDHVGDLFRGVLNLTLESGKKSTRLKKPAEITNDDIIGIINGLVKSEQTVLEIKRETTSEYLEILKLYLPKMVSREEIAAWIKENIDFSQYKNKMQTMGAIMKHFGKTADGKQVNQILQEM